MGLLSQYYEIENENIIQVIFAERVGESIEFTYFQDVTKLDQVSIEGVGEASLKGNGSEIKIKQTWLGTKFVLVIPSGEIQLIKIKKGEISPEIAGANEKQPTIIHFKVIVFGILLALVSLLLYYY